MSARKRNSALANHGVIAVRHSVDELVGVRKFRGAHNFIVRGFGFPISDVLPDRGAKQQALLKHETDLTAQRLNLEAANIDTVDANFAGRQIVKARQQADDGSLAGARRAHQRGQLAGLDFEAEVFQHRLCFVVGKVDAIEFDSAFEARRGLCARQVAHLHFVLEHRADTLPTDRSLGNRIGHL